jgi:uncharacterized repeat protein (TIGR03803 family)
MKRSQWLKPSTLIGAALALLAANAISTPVRAIDSGTKPIEYSTVLDSGYIYGLSAGGGNATNPNGAFWRINTSNNVLTVLHAFAISGEGIIHIGLIKHSQDGKFYACATDGGANSRGCVIKIDPSSNYATSIVYSIQSSDGDEMKGPRTIIEGRDHNLYCTTLGSTDNSVGANGGVFKLTTGGTFTSLYKFSGTSNFQCYGGLVEDANTGNIFYGCRFSNKSTPDDNGILFKLDAHAGSPPFTPSALVTFAGSSTPYGSWPLGRPVVSSGNILYCATDAGGTNGNGTIFKYDIGGTTYTLLHHFSNSTEGNSPRAVWWDDTNSVLYGFAGFGPTTYDAGTAFKYDAAAMTPFSILKTFTDTSGSVPGKNPINPILSSGTLYGTNFIGDGCDKGNIFKLTSLGSSNTFTDMYAMFTPYTVSGLTATSGATQNTLTWDESLGTTYDVYRSTTSGSETSFSTGISSTSYTNTGLTNGSSYYYKVRGTTTCSNGSLSTEVCSTPFPASPSAGVSGMTGGTTGSPVVAHITFTSPNSTTYRLYRSQIMGGPYCDTGNTVTGPPFPATVSINDSVQPSGTYYYIVAITGGGSAKSSEVSATIP